MRIREIRGKEIVNAYDGKFLSKRFGYSCANFNVGVLRKDMQGNDMKMFDFYIDNPNNISCFVAYDDSNKIMGRRMFFKGESLLNDEYFDVPLKMGETCQYMYGYYGERSREPYFAIMDSIYSKYKGLIHADDDVYVNGRKDLNLLNFFIMKVDKMNYPSYPPIDFLKLSPDLNALANFLPSGEVLQILKKDFKNGNIEFHNAYRYEPNKKMGTGSMSYKTWAQNYGIPVDEEDEDFDIYEEDKK